MKPRLGEKGFTMALKPRSFFAICRAAAMAMVAFTLVVQVFFMMLAELRSFSPGGEGLGPGVGYFAAGKLFRVERPRRKEQLVERLSTVAVEPLTVLGSHPSHLAEQSPEEVDAKLREAALKFPTGPEVGRTRPPKRSRLISALERVNRQGAKGGGGKTKVTAADPAHLAKFLKKFVTIGKAYMAVAEEYEDALLALEFAREIKACQGLLEKAGKGKGGAKKSAESPGEAESAEEDLEPRGSARLLSTSAPPKADPEEFREDFKQRMEAIQGLISRARALHYDSAMVVSKLKQKLETAEQATKTVDLQSKLFSQMAAKAVPKGMHCLAMRLMVERQNAPETVKRAVAVDPAKLVNRSLHHYALFSDNVLAAAVVVNSTAQNANDPSQHVFHIVTDRMNFGAMQAWFALNPPQGGMTVEVKSLDDFPWINPTNIPVLRQMELTNMRNFYFRSAMVDVENQDSNNEGALANFKYRNPKYLSILNHLRFYLPKMFPELDKVLFMDEDVVVQKDLSGVWDIDMEGNVNLAVETCGEVFHRFHTYLNFSHPLIAERFDPQGCGWAFGMNLFDLNAWRQGDYTEVYHYWQRQNTNRELWKLGTLPPALMTFYGKTKVLDKHWHVLGLGCNPNVPMEAIKGAAVLHFNGHAKPWLELAMKQYQSIWTQYVPYHHEFLQQCNITPP